MKLSNKDKFLSAHLDSTWFDLKLRKAVVSKLCTVIGDATCCEEYKAFCKKEVDEGKIPDPFLDFWYRGCTTSIETMNSNFVIRMTATLRRHMDEQHPLHLKFDPEACESWEDENTLKKDKTIPWIMTEDERGNNEKFDSYFPGVIGQPTSLSFHTLFTSSSFDHALYQTQNKFMLHPSCQVACNNRDVEDKFINVGIEPESSFMEYVTDHPNAKDMREFRFGGQNGYFILMERKKRSDVDKSIKKSLAPNTTMMEIATNETTKVSRYSGVKTLGDHVSMACSYESVQSLFKFLTVSTKHKDRKNKGIYLKFKF